MSDLLTRTEYQAIADEMLYPRAAFIDGKYQAGRGDSLTSINPATGHAIAQIAACNTEDVDFAVQKAKEAFEQGHWSKMHPSERKGVLVRLCKLMTRNRRELAVLESLESGKPIADCEGIDWNRIEREADNSLGGYAQAQGHLEYREAWHQLEFGEGSRHLAERVVHSKRGRRVPSSQRRSRGNTSHNR